MPIGDNISSIPFFDLDWTFFIVGEDTAGGAVHKDDTVAWIGRDGVTYYSRITGIDSKSLVIGGRALKEKSQVKINCPHGSNPKLLR